MAAVSNIPPSAMAQAFTAAQSALSSQTSPPAAQGNSFGDATQVTLSTAAQAAAASPNAPAPPPPPPGGGANAAPPSGHSAGGQVPITTSSTTSDTETLVEEAMQQVIPQVGVTGASEVVDDKGTIDEVKLQQLIQQEEQTPSAG